MSVTCLPSIALIDRPIFEKMAEEKNLSLFRDYFLKLSELQPSNDLSKPNIIHCNSEKRIAVIKLPCGDFISFSKLGDKKLIRPTETVDVKVMNSECTMVRRYREPINYSALFIDFQGNELRIFTPPKTVFVPKYGEIKIRYSLCNFTIPVPQELIDFINWVNSQGFQTLRTKAIDSVMNEFAKS